MNAKRTTIVLIVALIFYLVVAGSQGIAFIGRGQPGSVALGIAVLVLPLVGLWLVWRELRFGWRVQEMGRELAAERPEPTEPTETTESAEPADPTDWRSWFRVAAAYDAAGDRKRARAAMRHALILRQ